MRELRYWYDWNFGTAKEHGSQLEEAANKAIVEHNYAAAESLLFERLTLYNKYGKWYLEVEVRIRLGELKMGIQNYPAAVEHFAAAVNLARQHRSVEFTRFALIQLALVAAWTGDYALAKRSCYDYLQSKNITECAATSNILALISATVEDARGHYQRALVLLEEESFDDYESDFGREFYVELLSALGHLAQPHADNSYERTCLEQCLNLCKHPDLCATRSHALNNLGDIERFAGNLDLAATLYYESLQFKQQRGDAFGMAFTLEGCAGIAAARQSGKTAARLLAASTAIRNFLNTPVERFKQAEHEDLLMNIRSLLSPSEFEKAWDFDLDALFDEQRTNIPGSD